MTEQEKIEQLKAMFKDVNDLNLPDPMTEIMMRCIENAWALQHGYVTAHCGDDDHLVD